MKRNGVKIGLALGSGGARGLIHIGIIKSLVNHAIPIDVIAGCSAGAVVGGLYAKYQNIEDIETLSGYLNYYELISALYDPISPFSLLKGRRTMKKIRGAVGDTQIEELLIPFASVATDINSGTAVILNKGDLYTAIAASSSVPMVFDPVKYQGTTLIDGGVVIPVPAKVARDMGADIVIAVNIYPSHPLPSFTRNPTALKTALVSMDMLLYHLSLENIKDADYALNLGDIDLENFTHETGHQIIDMGERAMNELIPVLKKKISYSSGYFNNRSYATGTRRI